MNPYETPYTTIDINRVRNLSMKDKITKPIKENVGVGANLCNIVRKAFFKTQLENHKPEAKKKKIEFIKSKALHSREDITHNIKCHMAKYEDIFKIYSKELISGI